MKELKYFKYLNCWKHRHRHMMVVIIFILNKYKKTFLNFLQISFSYSLIISYVAIFNYSKKMLNSVKFLVQSILLIEKSHHFSFIPPLFISKRLFRQRVTSRQKYGLQLDQLDFLILSQMIGSRWGTKPTMARP